ncbi:hypothetical protein V2G26_020298 [Clonostachys chloroleuca]
MLPGPFVRLFRPLALNLVQIDNAAPAVCPLGGEDGMLHALEQPEDTGGCIHRAYPGFHHPNPVLRLPRCTLRLAAEWSIAPTFVPSVFVSLVTSIDGAVHWINWEKSTGPDIDPVGLSLLASTRWLQSAMAIAVK